MCGGLSECGRVCRRCFVERSVAWVRERCGPAGSSAEGGRVADSAAEHEPVSREASSARAVPADGVDVLARSRTIALWAVTHAFHHGNAHPVSLIIDQFHPSTGFRRMPF